MLYPLLLCILILAGAHALLQPYSRVAGFGLLLAAVAPLSFFLWLRVKQPPRTDPHPILVSTICGLGTVIAMSAVYRFGDHLQPFLIGAIGALLGWQVYLRWASRLPPPRSPPCRGQTLPTFSLIDIQGNEVPSNTLDGKNTILLFSGSNESPFRTAQMLELNEAWARRSPVNTALWIVMAGSSPKTLARSGIYPAPAQLMTDTKNCAAITLGIDTPNGVLPTVIVVDSNRVIQYINIATRQSSRPDPEIYLGVLDGVPR